MKRYPDTEISALLNLPLKPYSQNLITNQEDNDEENKPYQDRSNCR